MNVRSKTDQPGSAARHLPDKIFLRVRGDKPAVRRVDVGAPKTPSVPGNGTPVCQHEPLPGVEVVVERKGLRDDRCIDRHVSQVLADPWMRAHGRSDEEAVGGVPQERLTGPGFRWNSPETRPHIELCGTDGVRIKDVGPPGDSYLPPA